MIAWWVFITVCMCVLFYICTEEHAYVCSCMWESEGSSDANLRNAVEFRRDGVSHLPGAHLLASKLQGSPQLSGSLVLELQVCVTMACILMCVLKIELRSLYLEFRT